MPDRKPIVRGKGSEITMTKLTRAQWAELHPALAGQMQTDLCYCVRNSTGHVHGAIVDDLTWARGVLAIDELARGSMAAWAPRLTRRNRAIAEQVVKRN